MNKKVTLVMQILKTKAKSLGFNAAELKGVAEKIADNLKADDDADEDDIKSEAEAAVETALPYLEMAQKNANRIIEEHRRKSVKPKQNKNKEVDDDDDDDDDDDNVKEPAWLKKLNKRLDSMDSRLNGLSEKGTASSRKQKLEAVLKEAGSYGKRILKDFDKRKFDDDDDFNEYLDEVKSDFEEYKSEMEKAGLKGMVHTGGGSKGKESKKELSDKEIDEIANTF